MPPRPEHVLRSQDVELAVDLDAGARAVRWTVGDLSVLAHHGDHSVEHGMYPMAPWAGRVRNNIVRWGDYDYALPTTFASWALHGTVLDQAAEVIRSEADSDGAVLVARVAKSPTWPWPVAIDISWDLRGRTLTTEVIVHSEEFESPAVVGWHPWLLRDLGRGEPIEWSLEATQQVIRGGDYLPTPETKPFDRASGPFDDTFVVPSGVARLRWPGALVIDVHNDAPWYVVFDHHADAVCVEPQSGPPNGVNDGLGQSIPTAGPGRPHRMVTTWTMRDDQPVDQA